MPLNIQTIRDSGNARGKIVKIIDNRSVLLILFFVNDITNPKLF